MLPVRHPDVDIAKSARAVAVEKQPVTVPRQARNTIGAGGIDNIAEVDREAPWRIGRHSTCQPDILVAHARAVGAEVEAETVFRDRWPLVVGGGVDDAAEVGG